LDLTGDAQFLLDAFPLLGLLNPQAPGSPNVREGAYCDLGLTHVLGTSREEFYEVRMAQVQRLGGYNGLRCMTLFACIYRARENARVCRTHILVPAAS
jgi:hypothetical protein